MKMHHTRYFWILVALALAAFLLILPEAHGQSRGTAAVFEGRPAMAGAQAGQGAQAGPPQGGIGVQDSETSQPGVRLRRPPGLEDMPQGARDDSVDVAAAADKETAARKDMKPARDSSLAKDERSSVKKSKRAAKRTASQARHGVSEIDSTAATRTAP